MPGKKTAKKTPARKKRAGTGAVAKAKKATGKVISSATKTAKTAAAHPRKTVRKVAGKVQKTASRAHEVGVTVAAAGTLIAETADVVGALAERAKKTKPANKSKTRR